MQKLQSNGFNDKFCAIWGEIFKIRPKYALN